MKVLNKLVLATVLACGSLPLSFANQLTGDPKLACEAIMCLSTGSRPSECNPSISRFFSIQHNKWSDTLRDRIDFLNQCPTVSQNRDMQKLASDAANGAGRCDAATLNSTNISMFDADAGTYSVNATMPGYCTAYVQNKYTDLSKTTPVYVGLPERKGYWVEPAQYHQALIEYNARIAAEDAAKNNNGN